MLSFQPHIFSTTHSTQTKLYMQTKKYHFLSNRKKIWNEILKSWLNCTDTQGHNHFLALLQKRDKEGTLLRKLWNRIQRGVWVFLYTLSVTSIIERGENAELVKPLPPGMQNRPQRTITGSMRPEASCNTSPGAHTRETHGAGTRQKACAHKNTLLLSNCLHNRGIGGKTEGFFSVVYCRKYAQDACGYTELCGTNISPTGLVCFSMFLFFFLMSLWDIHSYSHGPHVALGQ